MLLRSPPHASILVQRFLVAAFLAVLPGCASSGAAPSTASPAGTAPTASSPASSSGTTGAAAKSRIGELRRAFDCETVSDVDVCSAKDGIVGTMVRKRLEPVVLSTGAISLRSVYRDRDWIYHDHVVVQIADRVLRSVAQRADAPTVSRRVARRSERDSRGRATDGFIAESVTYRGASDGGILEAIAKAGTASVHVRFTGGPRQFEMTMSDGDKRLFASAWELAVLYRQQSR